MGKGIMKCCLLYLSWLWPRMVSPQLWLPTQNLNKIKPVKTSRTENEKDPDVPHLSEKLLIVDG